MPTQERIATLTDSFRNSMLSQIMSMKLLELGPESTIVKMKVQGWFIVSENEVVQGGLLMTLADWAAVFAAMSTLEQGHTLLTDAEAHFKKGAKLSDEFLLARAKVMEIEDRTISVDIDIFGLNEELKATGKFIFRAPKPKTP